MNKADCVIQKKEDVPESASKADDLLTEDWVWDRIKSAK